MCKHVAVAGDHLQAQFQVVSVAKVINPSLVQVPGTADPGQTSRRSLAKTPQLPAFYTLLDRFHAYLSPALSRC